MSDKKEFVPFLAQPHQFLKRNSGNLRRSQILKTFEQPQFRNIKTMEWQDIQEEALEVQIIENNGRIESIQVTCKCGGSVVLQFDYPDEEKVLN